MFEEDFVPEQQAKELILLGFNEKCLGQFVNNKLIITDFDLENPAPLYSQAFRWIRQKYKLHACIDWSPSYSLDENKWSDAIYEISISNVAKTKEYDSEMPDLQRFSGKQLDFESTQ